LKGQRQTSWPQRYPRSSPPAELRRERRLVHLVESQHGLRGTTVRSG